MRDVPVASSNSAVFASLFVRSVILFDKVFESAAIEGLTHDVDFAYFEAVAQGLVVYVGCPAATTAGIASLLPPPN